MKTFLVSFCCALCLLFTPIFGQAADWQPKRPITIVVSFAPGGTHDVMARILVPPLEKELGTNVIVKNSSGAAGTIGAAEAAGAKPDGYTIYLIAAGPAITQPLMRDLPYKPDSFELISFLYSTPFCVMVNKDSKYKTLDDLLKAAKAAPGSVVCATVGVASSNHLCLLDFEEAFGVKIKHLPERSGAEVQKNLAGGVFDMTVDSEGYLPRYDVRGLVRFWPTRSKNAAASSMPAVDEMGKKVHASAWNGMAAPKGTPKDIIAKYNAALGKVIKDPKVVEQAEQNGLNTLYMPTAEFQKFYKDEVEKCTRLLTKAGLLKK